ncbi:TrbC/VirB2 family protein [Martelella sp. HB161492]|uniref:TrbC/VirB2 family protein n=1 Tax=Martelella sp. HB161492 TaxID=2720726 RepID=UPI0015927870|nr:TrbC/VirB2 family protein [Martelella sp. HB161492]
MTAVTAFDTVPFSYAVKHNPKFNSSWHTRLFRAACILSAALLALLIFSEPAFAQSVNTNAIQNFLQSLVDALTGTLGKTAATLALVGVFISWFFGVIDFRQAMWIVVAIVFVGAAPTVVNSLWGSGS